MIQEQSFEDKQNQSAATSPDVIMNPADQREDQEQIDNPEWEASSGFLTPETLPQDVQDALPKDAQMIFIAAYNSIYEGNHDAEAAKRVAWQSIERSEQFVQGDDGKWKVNIHDQQPLRSPSPLSAS